MLGLLHEIADEESVLADGSNMYIPVHGWSKYGKRRCPEAQVRIITERDSNSEG